MFHLKWIREIFEACHTTKSLDIYKRLNVPDMEWMKKALEACDITEALIENTGYIWTRMDTEAPEIISEYWTLTLDGENKTKQNYWVFLTQEWRNSWHNVQQWNKMAINGKHIDISGSNTFNLIKALKHWRMMNYWLCMPQCGQTKFQIMSHHWKAGMVIKYWLSRSRVDNEAL